MQGRIKITIEGPNGSGKTQIRRAVEAELEKMQKSYKTYDPVYKYKPDQIDFGDAEAVILVKTKNPKAVTPETRSEGRES